MQELSPEQLHNTCNPQSFSFETTAELPLVMEVMGQERATRALAFGLDIENSGYNIFVLGPSGTGRTTAIQQFLARRAGHRPTPDDWIYVYNFKDENHPRAVRLPPGTGAHFRDDMAATIAELRRKIPHALEEDAYRQARRRIEKEFKATQADFLQRLEAQASERGFTVLQTPGGLMLAPIVDGKPLPQEQFSELPQEQRERLTAIYHELERAMGETFHQLRREERATEEALHALDREVIAYTVDRIVDELEARYVDHEEVGEYLEELRADIVERADEFRHMCEPSQPSPSQPPATSNPFRRYQVNLLVDNSRQEGPPIVMESRPTFHNLMGRIEHDIHMGTTITDFTLLRAGAFHRANGGYLILRARDVLNHPLAWRALKRTLAEGVIRLEERGVPSVAVVTPQPEPIPLDVKVILLGSPTIYYRLQLADVDFRELFKVKVDFSPHVDREPDSEHFYALFIRARCEEEGLRPFDRSGVARVVEYGSRMADDQKRLSARFGEVADLLREANYWAGEEGRELVTAEDVERAFVERVERANRVEEEIHRVITERRVLVATEGQEVGQINGLGLNTVGDHVFGRPIRITARAYTGRSGVTDIQREVKLSAPTHGKGVLTLVGYLGGQYALKRPLTLSASVSFEQTYEEVRGDSASLAELCALLSSLSDLPIHQGIAVTGSVDQKGQVQPVGGVTAKIEAFYHICTSRGLTGEQGVVIPAANQRNLALREEVIQAVAQGRFHVYTVETADEAIELLTGTQAGERDEEGEFPEGTVHARVAGRLQEFARGLRPLRRRPQKEEQEVEEEEA
jgi:lon-related putative ATP-dependent protease